jgi:hypothetical protein
MIDPAELDRRDMNAELDPHDREALELDLLRQLEVIVRAGQADLSFDILEQLDRVRDLREELVP